MRNIYLSALCHVVSDYIRLEWSISIALGLIVFSLHLQEGGTLWKFSMPIQVPRATQFKNIYGQHGLSPKSVEWLLGFSYTFRREEPFGGKIIGGGRPLEIKCSFPSTLGHVDSKYMWLWGSISKTLGLVACFSCTFRREASFENVISFPKKLISCSFRI